MDDCRKKAKLSEVVDSALTSGPQIITRNGRIAAVVVLSCRRSRAHKTKRTGNLAEFFAASPLRGSGMEVERVADGLREIDLLLLDTNVISEWTKPQPNAGVVTWLSEADEDREYSSAS